MIAAPAPDAADQILTGKTPLAFDFQTMHRSRILKHAFSSVLQAAATLTGFEPTFEISQCCAIPLQIYARLRVTRENANPPLCTNRAELRSSSVRICPKKQMQPVAATSL